MNAVDSPAVASSRRSWKTWNQKVHTYLGLYFLVFLCVTGGANAAR